MSIQQLFTDARELSSTEIEARIKGPLLRPSRVTKLLNAYTWDTVTEYKEQRSRIIGTMGAIYRSIDGGPLVLKKKISTFKDEWYTIVLSTEEPSEDDVSVVSRYFTSTVKKRWSRMENKRLRLDVTLFDDMYQVEVEIIGKPRERYIEPFLDYISTVVQILQDSPEYISRKRFELVRDIVNRDDFSIPYYRYQKPVTLTYKSLCTVYKQRKSMMVTEKKDGQRFFIIMFNSMVYSVDTHDHVRLLMNGTHKSYDVPEYKIIDTEKIGNIYYAFDLVDTSDTPFSTRQKLLQKLVFHLPMVTIKRYYPMPNTLEDINIFWSRCIDSDGIIFISSNASYLGNVWKWKPNVTVDVWMEPEGRTAGVYECEVKNGRLSMIRFRDDKTKPNSQSVIQSNIRDGYPLIYAWSGATCYLMRKYHNHIKRKMLKSGSVLLDIGTGQGADLMKWKRMKKIYCVEPDENMRELFTERKKEMTPPPKTVLIPNGTWDVDSVCSYIPKGSVNIIAVFFCLNSGRGWEGLFSIIEHAASKRCKIVGIFMDRREIQGISCDAYTIDTVRHNKYRIAIGNTHVDARDEIGVQLSDLKPLYALGFQLDSTSLLTGDNKHPMTLVEKTLSGMYRKFVMTR
jgi:hypothetical protein